MTPPAKPVLKTVTITMLCQCKAPAFHELARVPQGPVIRGPEVEGRGTPIYLCDLHYQALTLGQVWPKDVTP